MPISKRPDRAAAACLLGFAAIAAVFTAPSTLPGGARRPLRWLVCLALLLSQPSLVAAQSVNNVINLFGGLMKTAIIEGAKTEWRKLRPVELACIEEQLQQQGRSTESLARQGIFPNDGRVASARNVCAKAATVIPAQITMVPIPHPAVPAPAPAETLTRSYRSIQIISKPKMR
jgi:hypothetical protein